MSKGVKKWLLFKYNCIEIFDNYIYLIKEREFVDIYKTDKILSTYPKCSALLFYMKLKQSY